MVEVLGALLIMLAVLLGMVSLMVPEGETLAQRRKRHARQDARRRVRRHARRLQVR